MKKYFDPELSIIRFADVIVTSDGTSTDPKPITAMTGEEEGETWTD